MKVKELKQNRAALIKEADGLLNTAEEEKRFLNETEQARYDELLAESDSIAKAIDNEERMSGLRDDLEAPSNEPIKNKPEPEVKGFRSLGEQLAAVINASSPGTRSADNRLVEARIASGLGETVPSDGGFLVQTDFSSELLREAFETGVLSSRVRKVPISGNANGLKINGVDETSRATGSRWGGVQIYSAAEAELVTAKKPKFKQIELKLNKIMGLCYLTDELVQDTTALESVVTQAFTEEFGFTLDNYILNGTGAGQPLGIMNSDALISFTRTAIHDIQFADIQGMWKHFNPRSKSKGVWLVNNVSEVKLWGLKLTDYVPLYMPPGGLSGAQYGTLLGRPVINIEQTSDDVGTTGDIILADFSQYLMIDKGGINTASSLHVRFLYDEQVLRFTYRVDGQPIWNSAITTYGGNNTVSPFVVLTTST
jgi:HK97 family phage major capsid protein